MSDRIYHLKDVLKLSQIEDIVDEMREEQKESHECASRTWSFSEGARAGVLSKYIKKLEDVLDG